jgi:flagellar protein FlgJ
MFGIKAGEGWNGSRAMADTVEVNGGRRHPAATAFRAYGSIEESVNDFAALLKIRRATRCGRGRRRCPGLCHSIGKSGYASDPEYGNKLNQILNSDTPASRPPRESAKL